MPRGSIDVDRAAAADLGPGGLCQQAVGPQVVVEPDAHEHACIPEAQNVLRLRLVLLGIHCRGSEARRRDALAADGLDETAQVGGGGHDVDAVLLDAVRLDAILRERPRRQDGEDRERERDESEAPRFRARKGEGPALPSSGQRLPAFATQMLFGITQWTFFSVSEIAPTRQSIATLARP